MGGEDIQRSREARAHELTRSHAARRPVNRVACCENRQRLPTVRARRVHEDGPVRAGAREGRKDTHRGSRRLPLEWSSSGTTVEKEKRRRPGCLSSQPWNQRPEAVKQPTVLIAHRALIDLVALVPRQNRAGLARERQPLERRIRHDRPRGPRIQSRCCLTGRLGHESIPSRACSAAECTTSRAPLTIPAARHFRRCSSLQPPPDPNSGLPAAVTRTLKRAETGARAPRVSRQLTIIQPRLAFARTATRAGERARVAVRGLFETMANDDTR
jgi:hypothetical protein